MPRKRNAEAAVSTALVKLLCGEEYHDGGEVSDDVLVFLYFAKEDAERRALVDAAWPQVERRCRKLNVAPPDFADVLAAHGIPGDR
jgi:hypothetical protein